VSEDGAVPNDGGPEPSAFGRGGRARRTVDVYAGVGKRRSYRCASLCRDLRVCARSGQRVTSILKPLWRDLADQCRADPARAVGEMRAVCDSVPGDPMKWSVTGSPGSTLEMAIGNHPAMGGDGAAPCPGELVTMALAACMDEACA